MTSGSLARTFLAGAMALMVALPMVSASAQDSCNVLPLIEADPMMPIPLIYIELPVTMEGALTRNQPADREHGRELNEAEAAAVVNAATNQFNCALANNGVGFATNSTPQMRVQSFAVPKVDDATQYIKGESIQVVSLGQPIELADGRFLIDYAIVQDGAKYLTGEMIFTYQNASLYLDAATVVDRIDLNPEPITIDVAERFTREIKVVPVKSGDVVIFNNTEEATGITISITDAANSVVFEGHQAAAGTEGDVARNSFVVAGLEPGDYTATITFDLSGIKYNVLLKVGE